MSNQLQITGGAKVRALDGVITGTTGVLSSVPLGGANGVATLDSSGKVPLAQLPASVFEYKGTWNATTNTPYLVNGVGTSGWVYVVSVGGLHDFGAGAILFLVGDQVLYDGSIWERSSGATGSVTSVALTAPSAFNVSGSPITTSGTLAITGAGTTSQYINGAGSLTTFPSLTGFVPYTGATNDLNLGTHNLFANNLFDGFTNVAASGSQIVLTIASTPSYTITGSGGQTIKLPDATTLPNGAIFSFNNNQSSGAININNNSNTLVVSVPSGGFAEVVLLDNSIAAGSWDRHFKAPSNVSWSTNTLDYAGSITSATWNGNVVAINRGGTGSSTQNFVDLTTTQTIGGAKTFSSSLTASSLIKTGGTSSQFLKADGSVDSNTYLTTSSAASTYVPYTGATANVDLGAFLLSASGVNSVGYTARGSGTLSAYLILKQGTTYLGNVVGYNSINANARKYVFISDVDGTNYKSAIFELGSLTNNTARTYTLPDASGTLALLESTQTFSGVNTFTSLNMFDASINYKTGGSIVNTSGYIAQGYDKSGTGAGSTLSLKIADGNSVKAINLDFVGSPATYTYTFPASSGTIALTSDLGSYVPYTGATANVDLGLQSLYAYDINSKGNGTNNANIFIKQGILGLLNQAGYSNILATGTKIGFFVSTSISTGYYADLQFSSLTAQRTYTLPDASGTLALTSQLTSGTVTSVAALTLGTTGTDLSSSVANSTTTPVITLNVPTASASNRGVLSSADWTTFNGKFTLPSLTSGSVLFSNGSTISQSNTNFFWDNTNARLGIGTNAPSAGVTSYSTTAATQFKAAGTAPAFTFSDTLVSSTYAAVFGLATSANHFVTGTAAGDMAIANQSTSAGAIVFGTGTTEKMRMTSTGKFSIGNTNDTYNLDVTGTGRFTSTLLVNNNASVIRSGSSLTTLGQSRYLNLSDYYGNTNARMEIGLGYSAATGITNVPALIGYLQTSTSGYTYGDLYFATRSVTTDTAPTVQLLIASTGAATFSSSVTVGAGMNVTGSTNSSGANYLELQTTSTYYAINAINRSSGNYNQPFYIDGQKLILNNGSGGNVGIGTSSPSYLIHGTANSNSTTALLGLTNSTNGALSRASIVINSNNATGQIGTVASTWTADALIYGDETYVYGSNGLIIYSNSGFNTRFVNGGSERMRITSGGNVLIGTSTDNGRNLQLSGANTYMSITSTNASRTFLTGTDIYGYVIYDNTASAYRFAISSTGVATIYALGSGTVTATSGVLSAVSDMNLKIEDGFINNALDKVMNLKPRYFYWKEETGLPTDLRQLGFYAQEVNEALGEEVANTPKTENDKWGIYDRAIIAMLTKAMQEMNTKLDEQNQTIQNLQEQINILATK